MEERTIKSAIISELTDALGEGSSIGGIDLGFSTIKLYDVDSRRTTAVTSDRFDSYSPAWGPDGRTVYYSSWRDDQSWIYRKPVDGTAPEERVLDADQVARCIEDVGVGFMFAPAHHSAMKHAIGPRKEMGVRTIFNVLGVIIGVGCYELATRLGKR